MEEVLIFDPIYQLYIENDTVILMDEYKDIFFEGANISALATALKTERTRNELYKLLQGQLEKELIDDMLKILCCDGFVRIKKTTNKLFLSDHKKNDQPLASYQLKVISVGAVNTKSLKEELVDLGVELCSTSRNVLVVCDDYLNPQLEEINRHNHRHGISWMLLRLHPQRIWIGPVVEPGKSACWDCLATRLKMKGRVRSWLSINGRLAEQNSSPEYSVSEVLDVAARICLREISAWLVGEYENNNKTKILTFDQQTYLTELHPVTKRPQCQVCGSSHEDQLKSAEINVRKNILYHTETGGYRIFSAQQVLQRLAPHINSITGVVGTLRELTETSAEIVCSFSVEHDFLPSDDSLKSFRKRLKIRAGGKGSNRDQAKVSAICEAIERYCGVYQGDEKKIRASADELGNKAVDMGTVVHFSELQYGNRIAWNCIASAKQQVMKPFDKSLILDWSPVWSLSSKQQFYIPTSYCYYAHPEAREFGMFFADSNGTAAGSCIEEAMLQGLLELVERDAVAMWWFNRLPKTEINLDSDSSEFISKTRDYYKSLERSLQVLDLTNDLQIPVFAAISADEYSGGKVIYGFGAHLDPVLALRRAVSEVNQSLPLVEQLSMNAKKCSDDPSGFSLKAWWRDVSLLTEPWLKADNSQEKRSINHYDPCYSKDIGIIFSTCQRRLESVGLEVFALDQSRADIELNVVKMIVPGLRHFWRRLGSGRLYDIPIKLGLMNSETNEEKLNKWDIYF